MQLTRSVISSSLLERFLVEDFGALCVDLASSLDSALDAAASPAALSSLLLIMCT